MFKAEATLQTLIFKYFERNTRLHHSIAFTTKTKVKSDERNICMVLPILLSALILSVRQRLWQQKISLTLEDFRHNPVDTRRHFNVYKTSIRRRRRRIDVLQTLKRPRVSTGKSRTKSTNYPKLATLQKFRFAKDIQNFSGELRLKNLHNSLANSNRKIFVINVERKCRKKGPTREVTMQVKADILQKLVKLMPKNWRMFWESYCPQAGNVIKKKTLAQVFSCEFCGIFKNTFFIEHIRMIAYRI